MANGFSSPRKKSIYDLRREKKRLDRKKSRKKSKLQRASRKSNR